MQSTLVRTGFIVLLGAVLHVLLVAGLYGLSQAAVPTSHAVWPLWYSSLREPSQAVVWLAPGLLVGWLVGRLGFALGALTGALGAAIEVVMLPFMWSLPIPGDVFAWALISGVIASAIYGAVSGTAGQALRATQVVPNYSLKRTAANRHGID
jgi:hypothetical protein